MHLLNENKQVMYVTLVDVEWKTKLRVEWKTKLRTEMILTFVAASIERFFHRKTTRAHVQVRQLQGHEEHQRSRELGQDGFQGKYLSCLKQTPCGTFTGDS